MTIRADILTTPAAVHAIESEWASLLVRSGCRHPFLSAEWVTAWLTRFGANRTLFVVAVRDDQSRLVGLAPLSVEPTRIAGIPVKRLCFIADRWVGSDYLSILVDKDQSNVVVDAIASALAGRREAWDYIDLADTDPDTPALHRLQEALAPAVASARSSQASPCPYAPLPPAFDTYFAALGSNLRGKLRRLGRRLAERGTVEWNEYTSGPELETAYRDLVRLHRLRFTDRGDTSAFLYPPAQEFHTVVLPALAAQGWVRLFVLRVNGTAIAALLGYQVADKFLFYQAGMDPAWSELRPGQLLMSHTIERAIVLGCVEYDFLRGSEDYKKMWASETRFTMRLTLYGYGWKASFARLAHDAVRRGKELKRQLEERPAKTAAETEQVA